MIINGFESKTCNKVEVETIKLPCGNDCNMYTISSIHDFIQFVGFGKYLNKSDSVVMFRGQTGLYSGKMSPSLYRGQEKFAKKRDVFFTNIKTIKQSDKFSDYEKRTLEALLQHYGIKTTQIDCVDNIWIALWFATHKAKSRIVDGHEHIYYYENDDEFSYVFLLACDGVNKYSNGIYEGEKCILRDLRIVLPSYFLRPHAQHAYMIMKKEDTNDFSDLIIGIAKIETQKALKWIGNSEILSVYSLFPSAVHDSGYEFLLSNISKNDNSIIPQYGSIQIVNG